MLPSSGAVFRRVGRLGVGGNGVADGPGGDRETVVYSVSDIGRGRGFDVEGRLNGLSGW